MDKKALTPKKKLMIAAACAAALLLFLYLSAYLPDAGAQEEPELARQIEGALSQMEGAGDVRVVIRYTEQEPSIPADAAEETLFGTEKEAKAAQEIGGVLIVAEGAKDIRVRTELLNAITALLDVAPSRVEILY